MIENEQATELFLDIPVREVACRDGSERGLTLDLYLPPAPRALTVYIHGGGWHAGSKDRPAGYRSLLKAGFALASVEYRFSTQGGWTDMLTDISSAVERAAERYHGLRPQAPRRLVLWGISAGGHLASLVSLHPSSPLRPDAVCSWCGPMDLPSYARLEGVVEHCREEVTGMLRLLCGDDEGELRDASPITHIRPDAPPHLFLHGDADGLVPPLQSERMHAALGKTGVQSELYIAPGETHALPPHHWEGLARMISFMEDRFR